MKHPYHRLIVAAILCIAACRAFAGKPEMVCLPDMVVSNDIGQCSAIVTFLVTATGNPTPTNWCVPPSGSVFPVGTNVVSCIASNRAGTTNCSFRITVLDTIAPQIICPADITIECAGFGGTAVPFAPTVTDLCGTNIVVVCIPPSDSTFPRGTTPVTCTATDNGGNSSQCTFNVTVQDTTPPLITCSTNIIAAEFPHDSGFAAVPFNAPITSDVCDSALSVTCVPPSGSLFALGITNVTCTATDDAGNVNSCVFSIRVIPYRLLVVTNTANAGSGSLRQALLDANDAPGENLIIFNIPAPPYLIEVLSALPVITSPIIIDGYSQIGLSNAPVVEIRGSAEGFDGLVITAGNSVVQGLILNGFQTAIRLESRGGNIIRGNFIGTDATGLGIAGNSGDGVFVSSSGNTIGGLTLVDGNVISGNAGNGIHLSSSSAMENLVRGNIIGAASDGFSALPNDLDGIRLDNGARANVIGGVLAAAANMIAFNGGDGVSIAADGGSGNAIRRNKITANTALGIDLGAEGVTANDEGDADTGPNEFQNYPVLTDVRTVAGVTTIEGILENPARGDFQLDFFLNDTADPSGFGEGALYLGSLNVHVQDPVTEPFSFSVPYTAVWTQYVAAIATDAGNNSSEFSRAFRVRTPPVLELQPVGTNTDVGGQAMFCSSASGTLPLYFQWRLNGVNIAGATNECYTLSATQVRQGGTYSVVVYNELGAFATVPAALGLGVANSVTAVADNFANRIQLGGMIGSAIGTNNFATREPNEPLHAGKLGGKSVWYKWTAPVTGIMTLGTPGSTFDTLLAVYTGTVLTNLVPVASDEDHGGYFTSGLRFNASRDVEYHFAIDGYGGAEGAFILSWTHEDTSRLLPQIRRQPLSQTVAPGSNVTFVVIAERACGNPGHGNCPDPNNFPPDQEVKQLDYQWFFNDVLIPGKTNNVLTVPNVQLADIGRYAVEATYQGRTTRSQDADLQINAVGSEVQGVQAFDKFLDAANSEPLRLGFGSTNAAAQAEENRASAGAGFVSGYTGLQTFNNSGSSTEQNETPCGTLGGASSWIKFVVASPTTLGFNTLGTPFDTVLAVYVQTNANTPFKLAGCGRNNLTTAATTNSLYMIGCDGVGGVTGTIQLGCNALTGATLTPLGRTPQGFFMVRVTGTAGMRVAVQCSSSFAVWSTLLTTTLSTGTTNITDTTSAPFSTRSYRVQTLP